MQPNTPNTPHNPDTILEKFFEFERWQKAIEKGVIKDIPHSELVHLTHEETRIAMADAIRTGRYQIAPPHTAQIPKDNGEHRTVYINEPIDRILLNIANDLLLELTPNLIHPACKSYQSGIGCGKVVQEASQALQKIGKHKKEPQELGWKADLSKYFDSVPIQYIHRSFDLVEQKYGHSSLIDVLRKYYDSDLYFDENGELQSAYQSLKQGCAVASWLANVLLYDIDTQLSSLNGYYVRYSDDLLYLGDDHPQAMQLLQQGLNAMQLKLNPKKVQPILKNKWFKFLGFSLKGKLISLSSTRIKTFQKEIEERTIKDANQSAVRALNSVNRYLYKGTNNHSWATQVLPICNTPKDIQELNKFVMDCLRAVETGKTKVGGLGYVDTLPDSCIQRGTGRNVTANRLKTPQLLTNYKSLSCMQKALLNNRPLYNTLVLSL